MSHQIWCQRMSPLTSPDLFNLVAEAVTFRACRFEGRLMLLLLVDQGVGELGKPQVNQLSGILGDFLSLFGRVGGLPGLPRGFQRGILGPERILCRALGRSGLSGFMINEPLGSVQGVGPGYAQPMQFLRRGD